MSYATAATLFDRLVNLLNSSKTRVGGLALFNSASPVAADGANGELLWDQTSKAGPYKRTGTGNTAADFSLAAPRFSATINIAASATTGTATLPAALADFPIATTRVVYGVVGDGGTAPDNVVVTRSGTTLTVTLGTAPGAGQNTAVTVLIY